MKKLSILLIILTSTILACNNRQHAKNWNSANQSAAELQHETASEKHGDKWKVDSITNNNVKNLQVIVKKFNSRADKSLIAYKNTGDDLQNALAKMIGECKMKGPNHEALHKWLEPLMAQVAKLQQTATTDGKAQAFKVIQIQASLYDQYFAL